MKLLRPRTRLALIATASVLTLALASCASGTDQGGSQEAVVDLAAAKEFTDPYREVTSFPVSEPLKEPLPAGSTVVFLDVGTDVAALQGAALKEATDTMGVELKVVPTGQSPLEISAALDSVVEMKPDVMIAVAIDPALFSTQLETLRNNGTLVVAGAINNGEEYGFGTSVMTGLYDSTLVGEIMAADLLLKGDGKVTELVFYLTPELAFQQAVLEGAQGKMDELCPNCTLRVVDIPIAELGTTSPQIVVSDLQANPNTGGMIFGFDQAQLGVPAALKIAGLDVPGIGWAPTPPNLDAIKQGDEYAAIGLDLPVYMWSMLDQAAREAAGQELSEDQKFGYSVKQIVVQDNVPADFSMGWSVYPDYRERFAKLWGK